jgi:hypothetical protein
MSGSGIGGGLKLSESRELFETTLPPANALANAISKLKSEIEQNKNKPYIKLIGEFLLQHLDKNPEAAEKILADKTISKSFDEMRKVAEKKKVGNCAVLTDQEGFAVVLKYYEVDSAPTVGTTSTPQPPVVAESMPKDDFDIKLEDLL